MVSSEALFTSGIFTLNYFPESDAIQAFIQGMCEILWSTRHRPNCCYIRTPRRFLSPPLGVT